MIVPILGYEREFKLSNTKKKEKFQETLLEMYEHQKIPERVFQLAEVYASLDTLTPADIERYQALDYEIVCAIKAAAKATGKKNFGYQRSPPLTKAGEAIRMHKGIVSCLRNSAPLTQKVKDLAKKLGHALPDFSKMSIKTAVKNVQEAWRQKRQIQVEDAAHRARWLEELAQEKAEASDGDADKILKQMIASAKMKGTFKKLRSFLKPDWSSLDYIEVPLDKWYLTEDKAELYQFDNGIFTAHASTEENIFDSIGTIKVPPKNVSVVKVEQ